ncbi:hypothetical protein [Lacicoccus qingdaonensis]|uniref:Uncharacterized protein n=1 Tax=Lacicoccus qingdaonensis TaxID=576118 RepID=A0A1G9FIF4_9BACL|nr:hypothetical protein [Salinicoccus qingdaonensis]SDK88166.1 hypothetical protein SAMN05216216_11250 [Salinicoccus qingdaonensis]
MKKILINTFIGIFIFFMIAATYQNMTLPITDTVQFIVKIAVLFFIASIVLKSLAKTFSLYAK